MPAQLPPAYGKTGKAHRWSGWPGAFCLDCGVSDPVEQAIADDHFIMDPEKNICEWRDTPEARKARALVDSINHNCPGK